MSTYEILITNNCNKVGLYKIETDRKEFSLKPVKLTYDKKPSRFEVPTIAILKNNQLVGKITLMAVHGTETFINEIAEDFTGDEIYSSLRFATDLMRSRKGVEIGVGVITSIHIKKGKRILERVLQVLPRILTEYTNSEIDTIIIGKIAAIDLDVNFTEKEYNHIENLLSQDKTKFYSDKGKEILVKIGYRENNDGILYSISQM